MSFRRNRERDESANPSTFYILKQFHYATNFMELGFLTFFVCCWIAIQPARFSPLISALAAFVMFVFLTIIIAVSMMENLMLSALAIHRFLSYFYPNTEKYLTVNLETLSITVQTMYVLIFIANFIGRAITVMMMIDNRKITGDMDYFENTRMNRLDIINQRIYFATILLLFFSASLYIPMIRSIRKLGKLQSAKRTQPEKYLLYQTLYLVVLRLLYLPILFFIFASLPQFNESLLFIGILLVDICITHFIIQASYLSCNRKHVETIYRMCDSKKNMVAHMDTEIHSSVARRTIGTSTDGLELY